MLKIPPIESPFFEEHFPAERTDPELLRVARSLHAEGLAVVDFPDDRLAAPAEEIIGNLGDRLVGAQGGRRALATGPCGSSTVCW